MPERTEFKCTECANRQTAICEDCAWIASPSGRESKPTGYVSLKKELKDSRMAELPSAERKSLIRARTRIKDALRDRGAIPLAEIMTYNAFVEKHGTF